MPRVCRFSSSLYASATRSRGRWRLWGARCVRRDEVGHLGEDARGGRVSTAFCLGAEFLGGLKGDDGLDAVSGDSELDGESGCTRGQRGR